MKPSPKGKRKDREPSWAEVRDCRKRSYTPRFAGLCAGARGLADQSTPEGDALLTWYRTAGAWNGREVRLYLARRVCAANWTCTAKQAAAIIEDAMAHVLIPPRRQHRQGKRTHAGLRKDAFFEMRGQAGGWLRAGILDAEYGYAMATREPHTP